MIVKNLQRLFMITQMCISTQNKGGLVCPVQFNHTDVALGINLSYT